jgi:integrative and conjugative element protein (TIGR02256 family)
VPGVHTAVPVSADGVWIARSALRAVLEETSCKRPLETGGMLLGYQGLERPEAVVQVATGPGLRARHQLTSFEPDGRWQQRELAAIYEASGRRTAYLGDWHSHPRGRAVPSARDVKTARKVSRRPRARAAHPLTLIVGVCDGTYEVCMHRYVEGSLKLVPWYVYEDEDRGSPATAPL